MGIVEQFLLQLNTEKRRWWRAVIVLIVLSLVVALVTVWNLRMTGITIANGAACGYKEHQHSQACMQENALICGVIEHTHQLACYSDPGADVETAEFWASTLPELTGDKRADIIRIAQSQLGYQESTQNYELASDGTTKNGITRYGQWYGNPYGDWANMFTAFCLRYAGFPEDLLNSGAEVMRKMWTEEDLYRSAGQYEPTAGDLVFLDKNQNGTVETTAIILSVENQILTVIEGNVNNAVVQRTYSMSDGAAVGYGITVPENRVIMFATAPKAAGKVIGNTVTYTSSLIGQGGSFILYTSTADGKYYAIDGNGAAVEIQIDSSGVIYADVSNADTLYWTFANSTSYDNKPTYAIKNTATGKYLHPYWDSSSANGVLNSRNWGTALYTSNGGVKFRGSNQSQYALLSGSAFTIVNNQNSASTFYFGKAPTAVNLWLDGTNGNIMIYRGSDNTKHTVYTGVPAQLPSQWKSPTKYNYTLAGWVNVKTGEYYLPGAEITVTEDTVLYADWVATTYDIGVYNSYVTDTVSTNDFITTHVFDYSSLINLLSSNVTVNVSGSSHSESWSHVSNGTVSYKGQQTLNFSFNDHDTSGTITNLNNLNDPNKYTGGTGVYSGIYNTQLGETLFGIDNLFNPETGTGVVGKHYLGQGDHLFQINTDPTSQYYGYYYYDAKLNAASYNQTEQRFYVYDYLERSSDSANNNDAGRYSDFLPLNSLYANTNNQTVNTFNYAGESGEYASVLHYAYDARFNTDGSATNQVHANLWFGMRVDVQFGLPDTPGVKLADGTYGNKDIYGNDMHFKFTGDDDVWVLIDGKVVLDLGGIHQAAEGDINFSTGEVRVNGQRVGTLSGIASGEHTLTILYLERGSSMSNCAIYFNLAPRFSLTLQKEDVLTQELLNGAMFAFYYDQACTQPCELWASQQAYKKGEPATNVFTIENGEVYIWGLSPSRTYYIKEVKPPDSSGYDPAKGVIRLTLDKNGLNSYSATILEGVDANGNKVPVSHGFTVHGFRIDEENQAAYIVITNAQNWVKETTSIYVEKKWSDTKDHTQDGVTVYLNITDPDGTVRRIREIVLSEENDWKYIWTNLPKYALDPETNEESDVPIRYSVSEAYFPGYSAQIQQIQNTGITEQTWQDSDMFQNGDVYVLKTQFGCLSTQSATTDTLCFVEEAVAKESPLALWTATVSNGLVRLTNQAGQILNFDRGGWCFNATSSGTNTNLTPQKQGNDGWTLALVTHYQWHTETVYLCEPYGNGYMGGSGNTLVFRLLAKRTNTTMVDLDGYGYSITNKPLETETSVKVNKHWDHRLDDASLYEKAQVTVKLFANGVDTGRTETINLKSNWTAIFNGLPYLDDEGNPITYTVVETWENEDWVPIYGQVTTVAGKTPTYEVTVTNTYRWIGDYALPDTGGIGIWPYILFGLILIVGPFVYGFSMRRRNERRSKQ